VKLAYDGAYVQENPRDPRTWSRARLLGATQYLVDDALERGIALAGLYDEDKRDDIGLGTALGGLAGGGLGAVGGTLAAPLLGVDPRIGGAVGLGLGGGGGALLGRALKKRQWDEIEGWGGDKEASAVEKAAAAMAKYALKGKDEEEQTEAERIKELEEKGRESAISGASRAHHMDRHQRGKRIGETAGRLAGIAGGGLGGALLYPENPLLAAALGMVGGGWGGGRLGRTIGEEIDIARTKRASVKDLAAKMVEGLKLAQEGEPIGGEVPEAPMASPSDTPDASMEGAQGSTEDLVPEPMPQNYLQAEALGQLAQNQQEANWHRQRADQAIQSAAIQTEQAQAEMQAVQEESAMLQEQASQAQQRIQAALQEAVQARDEALQQTEIAANMRMALQKQRQAMMEIASQDPAADSATALGVSLQQPPPEPPMEGVPQAHEGQPPPAAQQPPAPGEAPDSGMEPAPGAEGEGGGAPAAVPPIGAAPPGGGAPEPGMPQGPPAPKPPEMEVPTMTTTASVKTAADPASIGAAVAGGAGAISGLHSAMRDTDPFRMDLLKERLDTLQQEQDGSYPQAARLAKVKKQIAEAELAQQFPREVTLRRAAGEALSSALKGGGIGRGLAVLSR
jgi:hypothetical protein